MFVKRLPLEATGRHYVAPLVNFPVLWLSITFFTMGFIWFRFERSRPKSLLSQKKMQWRGNGMLFPGITEDGEETPLMKLKRPQEARLSSDESAELQAVKAGFAGSGRS